METPILKGLEEHLKREKASFHMPGHKGCIPPFFSAFDVTEVAGTGDLYAGGDFIETAEALWGKAWRVSSAQFLTGGSTQGLHAALLLARRGGRKILVDRACHRSVYNALGLFDFSPSYLLRSQEQPITAEMVEEALKREEINTVCITSPTYYGVLSDVTGIAKVCKERGAQLVVDAAHGAHLPFLPENWYDSARFSPFAGKPSSTPIPPTVDPKSTFFSPDDGPLSPSFPPAFGSLSTRLRPAFDPSSPDLRLDEDPPSFCLRPDENLLRGVKGEGALVVTSAHKTLPVFGQGAVLMAEEGCPFTAEDLRWSASVVGTSSPSYPILCSIDQARGYLTGEEGQRALAATAAQAEKFRRRFPSLSGENTDPMRLVVKTRRETLSGFALQEALEARGIYPEMADLDHAVFLFSTENTEEDYRLLWQALEEIEAAYPNGLGGETAAERLPQVEMARSPKEALVSRRFSGRRPLEDCIGAVAGQQVAPYPPGIPIIAPGERITEKTIAFLREIGYNVKKPIDLIG